MPEPVYGNSVCICMYIYIYIYIYTYKCMYEQKYFSYIHFMNNILYTTDSILVSIKEMTS